MVDVDSRYKHTHIHRISLQKHENLENKISGIIANWKQHAHESAVYNLETQDSELDIKPTRQRGFPRDISNQITSVIRNETNRYSIYTNYHCLMYNIKVSYRLLNR